MKLDKDGSSVSLARLPTRRTPSVNKYLVRDPHHGPKVKINDNLYPTMKIPGARCGWMDNTTPQPLYLRE